MEKKHYKKHIKQQFLSVEDFRDLLKALKQCSDTDLYLVIAFAELVLDDRKYGEE